MISIILPNLNGARSLRNALDSFLNQTARNDCELIVIDGKSNDGSHQILEEYVRANAGIRWINDRDQGISDAYNIGVNLAKGNIIGYLGGDDTMLPNLFLDIKMYSSNVDFDAIYFNSYTNYIKERRCILQRPKTNEITRDNLLKYGTIVGLQNIFFKKEILKRFPLNTNNLYSMDYELLLTLSSESIKYMYVDRVATINNFDGNISHDNPSQVIEAINVAAKWSNGYSGPLWFENLMSPDALESFRLKYI